MIFSRTSSATRPAAFTLVEFLCVIAVVGILVAILFPVLGMARAASRNTVCQNNLRQIGIAGLAWSNDNHARIFPVYIGTENNDWTILLAPYLNRTATPTTVSDQSTVIGSAENSVFVCPERPHRYGYGYNYYYLSWIFSSPANSINQWVGYVSIRRPATTVVLIDNCVEANKQTAWKPYVRVPPMTMTDVVPEFRHPGGTANVLWVDGHVSNEKPTGILKNVSSWNGQ